MSDADEALDADDASDDVAKKNKKSDSDSNLKQDKKALDTKDDKLSRKEKRQNKKKDGDRKGIFARMALFFRQTVAELRKVIWPTRKELIQYTWVVIVFCTIMALMIAAYDLVFAKLVLKVFG